MQLMIGVTSQNRDLKKCGPALRNRFEGDASVYKRLLKRELLRDPTDDANYFTRFLPPCLIKGAQAVFLYRLTQFMNDKRGTMDLTGWMARCQIAGNRFIET